MTLPKTCYYQTLQVNPKACPEVIKAAYRELFKKYHPDRSPNTQTFAAKIGEAYNILSNEDARKKYDIERAQKRKAIGSYRLLEQIGEGGFGKTFKCEHVLTGELSCLKDCSNVPVEYRELLIEEARKMWNLRHFGIPAIRDIIKDEDGSISLIMSFIPGHNLDQVIEITGKRIPFEHMVWILTRVLNILMYLHDNGTIHGDIKPQNIIVLHKIHMASLVDFGLSTVRPTADSRSIGYTDYYSPPEQINASAPPSPQGDFYSLGMTALFGLTGDIERVKSRQIPSDVPEELRNFIRKLIVFRAEDRPSSANQLFQELQDIRVKVFGRLHMGLELIPGLP